MKNLLLLASLGVLGYFGYQKWFAQPEIKPAAPAQAVAAPRGADDRIERRVRRMYEEWRDRALATQKTQHAARRTDIAVVLSEIREILGEDYGMHGPESVKQVIIYLLPVPASDKNYVYSGIMDEAERDGRKGGHNRSD